VQSEKGKRKGKDGARPGIGPRLKFWEDDMSRRDLWLPRRWSEWGERRGRARLSHLSGRSSG